MVQKRTILGKPALVYLTIGTTQFQFNRLLSAVDNVLVRLKRNYKLVAQIGNSNYKWQYNNVSIVHELTPPQQVRILKKADYIIMHAGFGTMHMHSLYSKKQPLIVARLSKFKEHVDDHQKKFVDYLNKHTHNIITTSLRSNKYIAGTVLKHLKNEISSLASKYFFDSSKKKQILEELRNYLIQ